MRGARALLPITGWAPAYRREDLRSDLAAGLTVGAMLVPQAMAYALLAGLPPEVGLYAATVPVVLYAVFGTSRQLAVGPVAIVSLLTATTLAPLVEEGTAGYVAGAALLALIVGVVHLVLGIGRLGYLVNFLSHSVLVGFTAAAAIIIGFSQVKHVLGVSTERQDHFYETVLDLGSRVGDTNGATLAVGAVALAALITLKRVTPRIPAALVVVVGSIAASEVLDLESDGVAVVGDIPDSLPAFALPSVSGSLVGELIVPAFVITMVGFMESIAVAKVYARRHRYEVEANQELVGLGAANIGAGLFGGYPVTGGFSRTAVNDTAGARTPLASIVTAGIVLATLAFLTPLLESLPQAALGAIIIMAVVGLVDVGEMRHIARVKPSDLIGMGVAFGATLALGIEIGIAVAVVASMLVVFARMSRPHSAVLGHVPGTTSYRNVDRFPEVHTVEGVRIIRIDAALSFVNASPVKKLLVAQADAIEAEPHALVLDASGINDVDATGADMLHAVLPDLDDRGVALHLASVKGPVRDVLRRAGLWAHFASRIHTSTHEAVTAIATGVPAPDDQRRHGIDERTDAATEAGAETPAPTR
ncbi:MAG: solute carrier family 26 protein [Actinomycetota bacterium]